MKFLKIYLIIKVININVDKRNLLVMALIVLGGTLFAQSTNTELANEYYINGDHEKAIDLFDDIIKDKSQIQYVHANYFALLISKSEFSKAEKYLNKVNKAFPNNLQYQTDLLYLYQLTGQLEQKDEYLEELAAVYGNNQFQLNQLSQMLLAKELYEDAKNMLLLARQVSKNPRAYALEMAALYRTLDQKDMMINEYLNYGLINNRNTNYVKNLFQMLLTEPGDFDNLKEILLARVQNNPEELAYLELLIWINLQQKDFYGAFVQARALDRRNAKPGDQSMQVAQVAVNNSSWEDAIEIYEYVIKTYPESYHFVRARQQLINARKNKVLSSYPVDKLKVQQLTIEYQQLFDELGPSLTTYEGLKEKASLLAYQLDKKQEAIGLLLSIIEKFSVPREMADQCKLLLGDIYLLVDQPWEASLLYGQVQKSNKYAQLGYDARLRNARLYYFTGDFALASSYLKILKRATTKKISNNAIDLGLLISNNTVLDSTDQAMKDFSHVELLNYQNKFDSSLLALDRFLNDYPDHSLTDEAYYLKSQLYLKVSDFEKSVAYLDSIIADYSEDILGDDAAFQKAKILEENLKDTELAQTLYRDFLSNYPGSLYASEARKRFRKLRGDLLN